MNEGKPGTATGAVTSRKRNDLLAGICIGVLAIMGFIYNFGDSITKSCKATQEGYNNIRTGMSADDVAKVFGCEGRKDLQYDMGGLRVDNYTWSLGRGGSVTVIFQNGRMVSKLASNP